MTFPCRANHNEAYEHACLNYLFLAFLLAPLIEQWFDPAMEYLREAARDIARNRFSALTEAANEPDR
jgi:hypothetical protein